MTTGVLTASPHKDLCSWEKGSEKEAWKVKRNFTLWNFPFVIACPSPHRYLELWASLLPVWLVGCFQSLRPHFKTLSKTPLLGWWWSTSLILAFNTGEYQWVQRHWPTKQIPRLLGLPSEVLSQNHNKTPNPPIQIPPKQTNTNPSILIIGSPCALPPRSSALLLKNIRSPFQCLMFWNFHH